MKNKDLKALTDYFGKQMPIEKITNRDTRLAIIGLYASLARAWDEKEKDINSVRTKLLEGHEEDFQLYGQLLYENSEESKQKAADMKECVRIDEDFQQAVNTILEEENPCSIKKVPLELLFDALLDCGFPGLNNEAISIMLIQRLFNDVIE